jgi:RNA polymerase sigma factor (sigma-70 family)
MNNPLLAESKPEWTDERLVEECLAGDERAWSALVDKHKSLVYSVPVRFGLSADDAREVFQEVFLSLLSSLGNLRDPRALPAWLVRTAWHKCLHCRRMQKRHMGSPVEHAAETVADSADPPEDVLRQIESEQAFRDALAALPPRCIELIRMLFFEVPATPYQEVATRLGVAIGSIGFIRMRCLDRLKKRLQEEGVV